MLLIICAVLIAPDRAGSATASTAATKSPVEIGIDYGRNLQATSQVGQSGFPVPGDQQIISDYTALIDYVNQHGGLLGHPIKPVYFAVNTGSTESSASIDQAICTRFTQDNHVFAAILPGLEDESLWSCLGHAHVLAIDPGGFGLADNTTFAQHPLYVTTGSLDLSRVAAVMVNGLFKEGFFGHGAKIGLLAYDGPAFKRAISGALVPALAKHHLRLTDQEEVPPVTSVADALAIQQPITNAVLRFKSEGINRVVFLDDDGGTLFNLKQAENAQQYFPRLGVTSNELLTFQADPGCLCFGIAPKIFANATGIGWDAVDDLSHSQPNTTGALCNKVLESAGNTEATAQSLWTTCDQFLVFAAAMSHATALTPDAAVEGFARLSNFTPAELVGPISYQKGHRDGAATGRFMAFRTSCECFQYTSGSFPLSTLENS